MGAPWSDVHGGRGPSAACALWLWLLAWCLPAAHWGVCVRGALPCRVAAGVSASRLLAWHLGWRLKWRPPADSALRLRPTACRLPAAHWVPRARGFLACRAPDAVSASWLRGRRVGWVPEVSTAGRQPHGGAAAEQQPAAPAVTLAVRRQGFTNPGAQNRGLEPLAARRLVRLRSPLWGQWRWWCGRCAGATAVSQRRWGAGERNSSPSPT